MPNQRAKNKVFFGGFVTKKFYRTLSRMAREADMENSISGFFFQLTERLLDRMERRNKRKLKQRDRG
jgi:hypothetical protein